MSLASVLKPRVVGFPPATRHRYKKKQTNQKIPRQRTHPLADVRWELLCANHIHSHTPSHLHRHSQLLPWLSHPHSWWDWSPGRPQGEARQEPRPWQVCKSPSKAMSLPYRGAGKTVGSTSMSLCSGKEDQGTDWDDSYAAIRTLRSCEIKVTITRGTNPRYCLKGVHGETI